MRGTRERFAVVEFPLPGASGPVLTQLGWQIGLRFERGNEAIDWRTVTSTSGTGVPDLRLLETGILVHGKDYLHHRSMRFWKDVLVQPTGEENRSGSFREPCRKEGNGHSKADSVFEGQTRLYC